MENSFPLQRALVLKQFQITQFQLLYVTTTAVSISAIVVLHKVRLDI